MQTNICWLRPAHSCKSGHTGRETLGIWHQPEVFPEMKTSMDTPLNKVLLSYHQNTCLHNYLSLLTIKLLTKEPKYGLGGGGVQPDDFHIMKGDHSAFNMYYFSKNIYCRSTSTYSLPLESSSSRYS